jgi:hypothetical protein
LNRIGSPRGIFQVVDEIFVHVFGTIIRAYVVAIQSLVEIRVARDKIITVLGIVQDIAKLLNCYWNTLKIKLEQDDKLRLIQNNEFNNLICLTLLLY